MRKFVLVLFVFLMLQCGRNPIDFKSTDQKYLIRIEEQDGSGMVQYTTVNEYNSDNLKIKESIFWKDSSLTQWTTFEYDNNNLMIKSNLNYGDLGEFSYVLYTNNNNGDVIKQVHYTSENVLNWQETFVYNNKNQKITYYSTSSNGLIYDSTSYSYDSRELLVRIDYNYGLWDSLLYDDRANLMKVMQNNADNSTRSFLSYEYDKNNLRIQETGYETVPSPVDSLLTYTAINDYDDDGHTTERTTLDNAGLLVNRFNYYYEVR